MDFKSALKWVFALFCIIFAFIMLFIILVLDVFFIYHEYPRSFTSQYIFELMLVALVASLPTLMLAHSTKSKVALYGRQAAHFIITFLAVFTLLNYLRHLEWMTIVDWAFAPVAFFVLFYVIAVLINKQYLRTKGIAQQNAEERKQLITHLDDLMRQHTTMRKFKHDQSNIFSSMDIFVVEDNWAGMKEYYNTKIKPAFNVITASDFALENLNKIKIQEIRGIFTIKLAMAQNMGIDTRFDADEDIDNIPIDSVTFVRILGIILDNAIEELEDLGRGVLMIGCYKIEDTVNFIVQNTCRADMPSLQQLQKSGFTTKGKGSGLGLGNLYELVDSMPNVVLSTSIKNELFTQQIMIGDMD